jgi:hypothetical protein
LRTKRARHWWITFRCNLSSCWQEAGHSGNKNQQARNPKERNTAQRFSNAYRTAVRHLLQECHRSCPKANALSFLYPTRDLRELRMTVKHNIVPLCPRRLMIRLPTPKNRKRCLPPPDCHKSTHRALPHYQQTALAQTLHGITSVAYLRGPGSPLPV